MTPWRPPYRPGVAGTGSAAGGPSGEGYNNRERVAERVGLMERPGFERFAVVGHDRGGRVAYRVGPTSSSAYRKPVIPAPSRSRWVGQLPVTPCRFRYSM